jgi:hypothetical protein
MKALLIILLAFFIMRWLMFRFAPVLLASFFRNISKRQGYYNPQHHTKTRKEGDIKIKRVATQDKKIDKDVGDYVAYTEVNEKTK